MPNISKPLLLAILTMVSLQACDPPEDRNAIEAKITAAPSSEAISKSCYQTVTGEGQNSDVQVLVLNTQGQQIDGVYHWLPAFKDQRLGRFSGKITANGNPVIYTYTQEGIKGSETLGLDIQNSQISVNGGPPEMGLAATLKQIDCDQLVDLPELKD